MPFPPIRNALLAAVLLIAPATSARAETALVAVAANFAGAFTAISAQFTKDTGHSLQATTGSTGKLYAQIAEGAPFEVLLSADAATPERLEAEGRGVAGSRFTYALGRLSLWSSDAGRIGGDPKAALLAPDVLFIAIANPDLAPYGVAARQALEAMGLWQAVQPRIVQGQNIGQTYALIESGAAQIGFVAASALQGPGVAPRGARFDIPQDMFAPIRQDAVLLNGGRDNAAATAFLAYLRTDTARSIALSFGYGTE